MSDASHYSDEPENGRTPDEGQGNWLTRNLWMLKGFLMALALTAFGVAILALFEGTLAKVVWAMAVTLAALLVIVQVGIGAVQATRST